MKKILLLVIAGLTLFSSTYVYAESTVSTERHYQKIERKKKVKKPAPVVNDEKPAPQVTEESELPKRDNNPEQEPNSKELAEAKNTINNNSLHDDSNISAKDDDSKQKESVKEVTDNKPAIETKATQEENSTSISSTNPETGNDLNQKSIIKDNDYFHNFKVYIPKIYFNHGSMGDLANTSSYISIRASYNISITGQEEEYVSIAASRSRYAYALGSDTSSWLSVSYKLKFNPHASKKRPPRIEVLTNTGAKIIDFKKISDYRDSGFEIHTGDDSFLERFYYPGCDANLLLENTNGEILRVPLPAEVIEQWHQIAIADLRKMKRDYEDA